MMSDEVLNPCPFCGGEAEACSGEHMVTDAVFWWVSCKDCGAEGPEGATATDAITAWNTRSPDAAALSAARREGELEDAEVEITASEQHRAAAEAQVAAMRAAGVRFVRVADQIKRLGRPGDEVTQVSSEFTDEEQAGWLDNAKRLGFEAGKGKGRHIFAFDGLRAKDWLALADALAALRAEAQEPCEVCDDVGWARYATGFAGVVPCPRCQPKGG